MKYKVGDKVKIRKDLEAGKSYGGYDVIFSMLEFAIKNNYEAIIREVYWDGYKLENSKYMYTSEMFEDKSITTVADLLNKTDVEQGGLIISISYPNAYFETTIGHNKINRDSELYKRFIKAYGDMVVDEISFDVKDDYAVVMKIKVDYADWGNGGWRMRVLIYATRSHNLLEEYPILQKYAENYRPYVDWSYYPYDEQKIDNDYWRQNCIIKDMDNDELFKVIQELTNISELVIGYADKYDHEYGIDFTIEIYNDYRE